MEKIQDIFLKIPKSRRQWSDFLTGFDLRPPDSGYHLDDVVGLFDEETGEILGTGSVKDNVIQYVATCTKDGEKSKRFNSIVTELSSRLASRGIYHLFVFTKPEYAKSFAYLGFHVLVKTEQAVLLEKGKPDIHDFLAGLPQMSGNRRASIVMNANPFTLGHRYLVEQAAKENDQVIVFVVKAEHSLFKTAERLELVQAGLSDLANVFVVSGGDYMVSFATFPGYFIKEADEVIYYQTRLDARLFGKWLVPALQLTSRYLGTEPLSPTTAIYNESLIKELSSQIKIKILGRKKNSESVISATKVREAIGKGGVEKLGQLVPQTTEKFIINNLLELQRRIKSGD